MPKDAKIIVVGSGFAGLTAASNLIQAGFRDVKLLEAKGRIGGRVCTTKPFTQNIIEMGANWIHGQKENPLYKLAKEHRLLAEKAVNDADEESRDYFFREGGKYLPEDFADKVTEQFEKLLDKAYDSKLAQKYRALSLGDYLDAAFAETSLASSQHGWRILEWCKKDECANDAVTSLFEVSASQECEYVSLDGEFYNSLGPGGYQAILDIILKDIPRENILVNTPVKKIQWDQDDEEKDEDENYPVRVVCENGQIFEADHVIVTVSLGVLKKAKSMFEPSLPKPKLEAIERLGFGVVDKIFLCFGQRFWPEDCSGIQLTWNEGPEDKEIYVAHKEGDEWKKSWFKKITGFDAVARHPTVLCGWIAGREALHMETLQDSEIRDTCVGLLRSFTNWSVPEVTKVVITRWGHDQEVLGSYSFIPEGVNGVRHQNDLASPLPQGNKTSNQEPLQVLFAGEATHMNFYTTAHGAYLSGVREAKRIIKHYSR